MRREFLCHPRLPILVLVIVAMLAGWLLLSSMKTAPAVARAAAPLSVTSSDAVRFVDGAGAPLANTNLWLFCYGDERGQTLSTQRWIRTNGAGEAAASLPEGCEWLVVLHQKHVQPSGKPGHGPAYWVFEASWQLTPEGLLPTVSEGTVVVKRPFVLFNVVASLEWQPAPSADTLTRLYDGMAQASLYLADLTDGYMAFGPLTIAGSGQRWEGADLRIHATNDLRPAAFVGGIVSEALHYDTGRVDPTFKPATIFLGRKWNGQDAASGEWDAVPGLRTLVHEWAHYALFLFDEYHSAGGERAYCTRPDLRTLGGDAGAASALAFHYTASELWHPEHRPMPASLCEGSDQFRVHGEADWRTLEDWYAIQGLAGRPGLPPLTAPLSLPAPKPEDATAWGPLADLFGRSPASTSLLLPLLSFRDLEPSLLPPPAEQRTLAVSTVDDLTLTQTVASQLYLLDGDGRASDPLIVNRILNQGNVRDASEPTPGRLGEIDLLGITPGDQVRVYVDRYAAAATPAPLPGRFTYQVDEDVPAVARLEVDKWEASLDFVYTLETDGAGTGLLKTLEVVLKSRNRLDELAASPPLAMLCVPDAETGCNGSGWQQVMARSAPGIYTARFVAAPGSEELPLYGVVRVHAPGAGELVRWLRDMGGVGPAHMFGGAALREGVAMVDTSSPIAKPGECNRVMVMPATDYDALEATLPTTSTLVSLPIDIDILLGGAKDCKSAPFSDIPVPASLSPLRLTLFYNEDVITRLGIDETTLHVVHYERSSGDWLPFIDPKHTARLDADLNWAAALIVEDGIYAVAGEVPGP